MVKVTVLRGRAGVGGEMVFVAEEEWVGNGGLEVSDRTAAVLLRLIGDTDGKSSTVSRG